MKHSPKLRYGPLPFSSIDTQLKHSLTYTPPTPVAWVSPISSLPSFNEKEGFSKLEDVNGQIQIKEQ